MVYTVSCSGMQRLKIKQVTWGNKKQWSILLPFVFLSEKYSEGKGGILSVDEWGASAGNAWICCILCVLI